MTRLTAAQGLIQTAAKRALMTFYGYGLSRAVVQRIYDFLRLKSA